MNESLNISTLINVYLKKCRNKQYLYYQSTTCDLLFFIFMLFIILNSKSRRHFFLEQVTNNIRDHKKLSLNEVAFKLIDDLSTRFYTDRRLAIIFYA